MSLLRLLAMGVVALGVSSCADRAATGKTFSVLGDSYSTFVGRVSPDTNYVWYTPEEVRRGNTDVDSASQMWWSILADSLGMRMLQNNSFSGATVCNRGYDGADYSDRSFITRQDNLPKSDYVFIFGGTNDSWAGAPVGVYDHSVFAPDSLYSFRPAMSLLLARLRQAQPEAEIVVIINSQLRNEITESMMSIADHYGVAYVCLYDVDKRCGHPTKAGQEAIARQVARRLAAAK